MSCMLFCKKLAKVKEIMNEQFKVFVSDQPGLHGQSTLHAIQSVS